MATFTAPQTLPAKTTARRNKSAFERSVAVFRAFREMATPEEMERIAARLEQALSNVPADTDGSTVREALMQTQTFSPQERLEWEATNTARYFQKRRELLQDSLSAPEVAQLLGTTRQTPHDRVKAGTLLAVRDRGGLRFPRWQFDAAAPDGVLDGLPDVLKALDVSALRKISWFVRPQVQLEGKTPLEVLRAGHATQLVRVARTVGVS